MLLKDIRFNITAMKRPTPQTRPHHKTLKSEKPKTVDETTPQKTLRSKKEKQVNKLERKKSLSGAGETVRKLGGGWESIPTYLGFSLGSGIFR
ncbi:hypothetical protein F2Q69_00015777 [Brassica cretica]|uniref:Uncharacterized protein n=1 Tax=Brassica cretica TaxID=69181 RepID=A0A8S9QPB6_BRACR|nr:hypothetical protein F2Q69_00015777 [Brassica cretica]